MIQVDMILNYMFRLGLRGHVLIESSQIPRSLSAPARRVRYDDYISTDPQSPRRHLRSHFGSRLQYPGISNQNGYCFGGWVPGGGLVIWQNTAQTLFVLICPSAFSISFAQLHWTQLPLDPCCSSGRAVLHFSGKCFR